MSRRRTLLGALITALLPAALLPAAGAAAQPDSLRAAAPAAAPGDTLRLTLEQSIATALKRATSVLTAQEDERMAAATVLRAYGQFLPTLSGVSSTYSESGNPLLSSTALLPTSASLYGLNVGLSTTYTLFNGTRDRAALRAAVAQREAAGLTLGRAREEIAYDVANAYYQVVLDDRLAAVARTNLALSRQREAQLTAQVRVGTKAPPDLYRQQAQTRADEAAVIAADNRGDADRISLLQRLRLDPAQPLAVTLPAAAPDGTPALFTAAPSSGTPAGPSAGTPPVATRADVTALEREALVARPDLAAASAQRRAAQQQLRFAHGERLPTIGIEFDLVDQARIFGHAVQNGQNLIAPGQRSAFSQLGSQVAGLLSLGVNLPIFDRHQARADEERAQAYEERSRVAESDVRDRIVGEVARSAADIRAADLTAQAAAAQVAAAEKAFAAVSGRYEVGMANFIDVASAQTALAQARQQREQATVNQSLARARLGLATGRGVRAGS